MRSKFNSYPWVIKRSNFINSNQVSTFFLRFSGRIISARGDIDFKILHRNSEFFLKLYKPFSSVVS
ncbi:hypothetical protein ATK78_0675 [Pedobacter metabolipauper]|uniref:Uncharacterized protein n=1 Tax=Pedobacter metabolipauper TaxID=425513 RepID=A0A4R6SZM8_9SPHI|nr:hypothetical protein ATK78_0675 [Pedobacter metabolipauper]